MGSRAVLILTLVALIMGSLIFSTEGFETHHRVRRQQEDNSTTTTTSDTTTAANVTDSSTSSETTTTATTTTTTDTTTQTATTPTATTPTATTPTVTTPTTTTPATSTTTSSSTTTTLTTTAKTNTTTKTTTKSTTVDSSEEDVPVVLNKFACSGLKEKHLEKCCKAPIIDFFSQDQKLTCNNRKVNFKLFSSTKDYFLHKLQNKKTNTIDFGSKTFVNNFGKTACFMQCLFKNTKDKAFDNGEISEDALATYLNENLSEEWVTVITEAVTTCVAGANEVEKKTIAMRKLKVTKECSMLPAMVMQCIIKKINTNCPKSARVDTVACAKTRASFDVCNEFTATEIDTSQTRRSKHSKMSIKIKGAVNIVKSQAIPKSKVV